MISLNATLIVQAIHFFIAYLILRFLLFRPALALINKERSAIEQVHYTIGQTKEHLTEQQLVLREEWQACRDFFAQNRPLIEHPDRFVFRSITPAPTYTSLPEKTITHLADETAAALAKKLGTDYAV